MTERVEVLIVGMGPAGMAAAIELCAQGVQVAIVDENALPGGQVYRPSTPVVGGAMPFPWTRQGAGKRLGRAFAAIGDRCTVYHDTVVWGAFDDHSLALIKDDAIFELRYDKLLLCEGAMERPLPFPGWTLPGVMTLGGLQKLVVHDRCLPGRRFLLAGCSPLLIPTAASIIRAGGEVVAIADALSPKDYSRLLPGLIRKGSVVAEALGDLLPLLLKRIPILRPSMVMAASGEFRVKRVRVAALDDAGYPIKASEKTVAVDILGVSGGFLPSARIARLLGCLHVYDGRRGYWKPKVDETLCTSQPDVYVAGDSGGIGGREAAEIQGRLAGVSMARDLGRLGLAKARAVLGRLTRAQRHMTRWADTLDRLLSLPSGMADAMDEGTIVCRCEQVTVGDVLAGIGRGYRTINEIKRTRVGMGLCQGRMCESVVTRIMLKQGIPVEEIGYLNLRPPLSPMPLAVLEKSK